MKNVLALAFVFCVSALGFAQQEYVSRYDGFAGFSYLNSPKLNLAERGFNGEFGINVKRWFALGGDYSIFTGHSDIRPQDLTQALQVQLAPTCHCLGQIRPYRLIPPPILSPPALNLIFAN